MTFDVETYEHDKSQTLEVGCVITNLDKPDENDAFHNIIDYITPTKITFLTIASDSSLERHSACR